MKKHRFFSLLWNSFPFVRAYLLHRKIQAKKIKICRKLKKIDPKHLRRYIIMSGTIRRL